ncbi:MAG: hypothetical protein ACFCU6_09045 [Balneolaceae bacterium]
MAKSPPLRGCEEIRIKNYLRYVFATNTPAGGHEGTRSITKSIYQPS